MQLDCIRVKRGKLALPLRVAMITGSVPPEPCGVGDYANSLSLGLQGLGVKVDLIVLSYSAFGDLCRNNLRRYEADIIHVHYPTLGYGRGLSAHAVALCNHRRVILTLHEFSQVHVLRRLAARGLLHLAKGVIFTTQHEYGYAKRKALIRGIHADVIPLGSSIPRSHMAATPASQRGSGNVVYFGLMRENKGIESVIQLAQRFRDAGMKREVIMVGSVPGGSATYFESLKSQSAGLPIRWLLGASSVQVADLLAQSPWAYLPFPDGASERRSSLLAMIANGVEVVTTDGPFMTTDLRSMVHLTNNVDEALSLMSSGHALTENRSAQVATKFQWQNIAQRHLSFYLRTLATERRSH
jgi:glycosyltransferase involved in cell wall biosynthesis